MPVDTRSKRASAVQILAPFILAIVLPDGTIDQGDRQHIAWTYAGILAGAATPDDRICTVPLEDRVWTLPVESRVCTVPLEPLILEVT